MEEKSMRHFLVFVCVCVALSLAAPAVLAQVATGDVPTPESVFGFTPGADRKLIDYSQQIGYLEQLAQSSPRVMVEEIGRSTLDRPMVMVFISSEENLGRLEELKQINRRLALDPAIPDDERLELIGQARVFVMATLSMHSTEVGPAQTLPILAYRLATAGDEQTLAVLDDVVVMVVACLNPDGMDMVVHHYRDNLGTRYEGASMPGLYHHYVGHDNNRDFVTLSQAESRAVSRVFSTEWYPQVLIDKHQMGRTGPRYFVPRYHDPIAENIDGKLWTWSDVFGSGMAREIAHEGLTGVASNWVFDEYWPGATTTSHWKGVISLLTEAASARVATPVFVEKSERSVRGKGLSEYKKSVNMPSPWPGGWWRLGDIVDYELASWTGALNTASMLRTEILTLRNDLCREEVERGRTEAPAYYVVPRDQHDASERDRLVSLLVEHGVEIAELSGPVAVDGRQFDAGDVVVPLAQPYRPFIKEVMESQTYPVRHYTPDGEIIKPYDITSWSLPLHLGVEAVELDDRSEELESLLVGVQDRGSAPVEIGSWGLALDPRDNASFRVVFDLLADGKQVHRTAAAASFGGAELPPGAFVVETAAEDLPGSAADARVYGLDERPTVAMNEL
ncbi:MAG: M14 family zinc carboxypeptidase, partial [Candidatus Sulfomarinibacteraceae bacterium]